MEQVGRESIEPVHSALASSLTCTKKGSQLSLYRQGLRWCELLPDCPPRSSTHLVCSTKLLFRQPMFSQVSGVLERLGSDHIEAKTSLCCQRRRRRHGRIGRLDMRNHPVQGIHRRGQHRHKGWAKSGPTGQRAEALTSSLDTARSEKKSMNALSLGER